MKHFFKSLKSSLFNGSGQRKLINMSLFVFGFVLVLNFQNCSLSSDSPTGRGETDSQIEFKTLTEDFLDTTSISTESILEPSEGVSNPYYCENNVAKFIEGDRYFSREVHCGDYKELLNYLDSNGLKMTKEFFLSRYRLDDYIYRDLNKPASEFKVSSDESKRIYAIKFNKEKITNYNVSALTELRAFKVERSLGEVTSLDLRVPNKLVYLSLQKNRFSTFNINAWPETIRYIYLYSNPIKNFDTSALPSSVSSLGIGGVTNDLVENLNLETLPENLYGLYVSHCNNNILDTSKLPRKLRYLFVSDCGLSGISEKDLPENLLNLHLHNNKIEGLKTEDLPRSIEQIGIYNNKIQTINTIGLPENLLSLYIGTNLITEFDASEIPKNMGTLNMTGNQLTTFDASHLPESMVHLTLANNSLTSFEAEFLPEAMKVLNLSNNNLTSFNNAIVEGTELEEGTLYLYGNMICDQELPSVCKGENCAQICDE